MHAGLNGVKTVLAAGIVPQLLPTGCPPCHRGLRERKFRQSYATGRDFHRARESDKPRDPRLFTRLVADRDDRKIRMNESIERAAGSRGQRINLPLS